LGAPLKGGVFSSWTAEKIAVQRSKKYFESGPSLILVSCSTGAEGGIGQTLSKSLDAKVIAPILPSSLKDLGATYDENGKLALRAEFASEKNEFVAGAKAQNAEG
jgi:hypothetical protein